MITAAKLRNFYSNISAACDYYAAAVLKFSDKNYLSQISVLSDSARKKSILNLNKYIAETPVNPHYIWGGNIGGIWQELLTKRDAYAAALNDVTAEELSLITRFTSGMTFYNAYNLRSTSAYWKGIWDSKMALLTPKEVKICERVIKEYTNALDSVTDKLKRYDGIVYRGVHSEGGGELIAQLQSAWNSKSKTWTNKAAASSSTDCGVAFNFDHRGYNDLIMIIKNKSGGYIRPVSHYDHEKEVLLIRNTKYKLTKEPYRKNGIWYVEMEEM